MKFNPIAILFLSNISITCTDKDQSTSKEKSSIFASCYTYKCFDGKISKAQAVEQMTEKEWEWYLLHEKEIYINCSRHSPSNFTLTIQARFKYDRRTNY